MRIDLLNPAWKGVKILKFYGFEGVFRLFSFKCVLKMNKNSVEIWSKIGFEISCGGKKSYIHGRVSSAREITESFDKSDQRAIYEITVVPKMWSARHTARCRIFQNITVMDIIRQTLQFHGVKTHDLVGNAGREIKEFCVQYNESDYDFLVRLMADIGVFYFFEHNEKNHILVLADGYSELKSSGEARLYNKKRQDAVGIYSCSMLHKTGIKSCVFHDFSWERPDYMLKSSDEIESGVGEYSHYPGGFKNEEDGEGIAKRFMQSQQSASSYLEGSSTDMSLRPGMKWNLEGHPNNDLNKTYVMECVEHRYELQSKDLLYVNTFRALTESTVYKSPRLEKPIIAGVQTAIVTGRDGEEVWADRRRIHVKFHWDSDEKTEATSCWIRVGTPWAGNGWGICMTPRIGDEVVISFMNGDPDHPMVISSVYNGNRYAPCEDPLVSMWRSRSSKNGDAGSEISMHDHEGEEKLYIKAKRDKNVFVENDYSVEVDKGSMSTTISHGDHIIELSGKDGVSSGSGNDVLTIARGDKTLELKSENGPVKHQTSITEGDFILNLKKGEITTHVDEGDVKTSIDSGNVTLDLKKGEAKLGIEEGSLSIKVGGNSDFEITNGSLKIKVVDGDVIIVTTGNIKYEAAGDISFKAGGGISCESGGEISLSSASAVSVDGAIDVNIKAAAMVNVTGTIINLN